MVLWSYMTEFCPRPADIGLREEYQPADATTVEIITDYLDHIIDLQENGRSATSHENKFSEWFETNMLIGDLANRNDSMMSEMRIAIRRTDERDTVLGGETYTVLMSWAASSETELIDNGYTKTFVLMRPHSDTVDEATFLHCYQQSAFIRTENGTLPEVDTIQSSYHEVDRLLENSFLRWQRGSQYDAEQLFDELTLFNTMLSSREAR